jgi:hypothetical protein
MKRTTTVVSWWPTLLMFVCCLVLPSSGSAIAQDISLVALDDAGLVLECVVPSPSVKLYNDASGAAYHRLRIADWSYTAIPGQPELPMRGVLVQVPEDRSVHLEILAHEYRTQENIELYPVPRPPTAEDGMAATGPFKAPLIYGSSEFFPDGVVEISERHSLRGVPVVRLMFKPFQWNPATKQLRCASRIRIKVHFEEAHQDLVAGDTASSHSVSHDYFGPFEQMLRESVINYQQGSIASPRMAEKATTVSDSFAEATPDQSMRLEIKHEGIYRVTYRDLVSAGLPGGIDPRTFRLLNRGKEVAIRTRVAAGNFFRPGDYLEFFARGINNQFTDTNVYWLHWGEQPGIRMPATSGAVFGARKPVAYFSAKEHFEENHQFWEALPGGEEEDRWFWDRLTAATNRDYAITLPAPVATGPDARIEICLRGYTNASPHPNHHARIALNGTPVGEAWWDGTGNHQQQMPFAPALLKEGGNTLTIELPGDTGAVVDGIYLNWIELNYRRRLEAQDDVLTFAVKGNKRTRFEIKNFRRPNIRIFDVTNPLNVKKIKGFRVVRTKSTYKAVFESDLKGARTFHAQAGGNVRKPFRMATWQSPGLRSPSNGADYILITARDFVEATVPLRQFRESQNLRVKVVAVEDIYNEFSHGLFDPQAIKAFLTYAYTMWERPAPTYVFLLGDANTDYRDYLASGLKNWVPSHLSVNSLGVTPDDNWYVAVDGDDVLPEMFLGRMTATTPEAASAVVNKILQYEQDAAYRPRKALFVADNDDANFQALDEVLIGYLPSDFETNRVYFQPGQNVDQVTNSILGKVDEGMLITTYVGHGNVILWGSEKLIEPADVDLLSNGDRLTFLLTFDCLNGYFSHPYYPSIGEKFAIAPDKGAIASFSPTGWGYTWEHEILGKQVFDAIFNKNNRILGSVTTESKIKAYALGATEEQVRTFTLIGDPAVGLHLGD